MTTSIGKCPVCNADAINRSEFWEASPENGEELLVKLSKIENSIKRYYLALDNRESGAIALDKMYKEIEKILEMQWNPGEIKNIINNMPILKKIICEI